MLEDKIDALLNQLDEVRAEIREDHPRLAASTQANPLQADEIQALLEPGSLLLVVRLGSPHSFLWSVTHTQIKVHILPSALELEQMVSDYRSLVEVSHRRLALIPAMRAAKELGKTLLSPVEDLLKSARRILWAADAPLSAVPLGGLIVPLSTATERE